MTCHWVCNRSNTTGVNCGEVTPYPSGVHEFTVVSGFVLFMSSNYISSCF